MIRVIVSADAKEALIRTDSGDTLPVAFLPETKMQQVAPGERDLSKARTIQAADLKAGDRVLVRGVATEGDAGIIAASVVVVSGSDITAKQEKEKLEWQRRGIGGIVTAVDTGARQITIRIPALAGAQTMTISLENTAQIRQYAADSVRFADAKPSTIEEIRPGDQLRALGNRIPDTARFSAEEVVTGSFQTIAATVAEVNPASREIVVKEIGTGRTLHVALAPDSVLKRFPASPGRRRPDAGHATDDRDDAHGDNRRPEARRDDRGFEYSRINARSFDSDNRIDRRGFSDRPPAAAEHRRNAGRPRRLRHGHVADRRDVNVPMQ